VSVGTRRGREGSGQLLIVLAVLIVTLMVTKPGF
jgi:hypothetical protein